MQAYGQGMILPPLVVDLGIPQFAGQPALTLVFGSNAWISRRNLKKSDRVS